MRNKKKEIEGEGEEKETWGEMQERGKDKDETLGCYIIEIPLDK